MIATALGTIVAVIPVVTPTSVSGMYTAAQYSWFIGIGLGLITYVLLARRSAVTATSLAVPADA